MGLPASLTDPWFDAHFYGYVTDTGYRVRHEDGSSLVFREAQGLFLWCPCGYGDPRYQGDGGRPHGVLVPFANPPSGVQLPATHGPTNMKRDGHPRWTVSGSGLADLTIQPSIDVGDDHCWHGWITSGQVR